MLHGAAGGLGGGHTAPAPALWAAAPQRHEGEAAGAEGSQGALQHSLRRDAEQIRGPCSSHKPPFRVSVCACFPLVSHGSIPGHAIAAVRALKRRLLTVKRRQGEQGMWGLSDF